MFLFSGLVFLSEVDLRDSILKLRDFTMKKTGNGNQQHTWRSLLHNFFPLSDVEPDVDLWRQRHLYNSLKQSKRKNHQNSPEN